MQRLAAASSSPPWARCQSGGSSDSVPAVRLLGVRVTAHAIINMPEHQRRQAIGVSAVTDPALLDRLLDLPVAIPVIDPVIWAEMADQLPGVVERSEDTASVTRHLEWPLTVEDIVVSPAAGRELGAVQDASLFAGFARRWVAAARSRIPNAVLLEAKLHGIGVLDRCGRVQLGAEKPVAQTMDGWSWLLQEKVYRRWLNRQSQGHATATPAQATDGANAAQEEKSRLLPVKH